LRRTAAGLLLLLLLVVVLPPAAPLLLLGLRASAALLLLLLLLLPCAPADLVLAASGAAADGLELLAPPVPLLPAVTIPLLLTFGALALVLRGGKAGMALAAGGLGAAACSAGLLDSSAAEMKGAVLSAAPVCAGVSAVSSMRALLQLLLLLQHTAVAADGCLELCLPVCLHASTKGVFDGVLTRLCVIKLDSLCRFRNAP
jgi:hypothetical protein